MLKSDLTQLIAQRHPHLAPGEAKNVTNAILEAITAALARCGRVEIRGFGAFTMKERAARISVDPRTGERVGVANKRAIYFRPGKELRERLNAKT
jgi:integration host factor subunit beta